MYNFELINEYSNKYFNKQDNLVLLTFDEGYYMQAINAMMSIKYHNPNTSFICICTELPLYIQQELLKDEHKLGVLLYQYQINFTFQHPIWHDVTCFRIFAPWLILQQDITDVLYIDADVLCKGDLSPLFNIKDYFLIMTSEIAGNIRDNLNNTTTSIYCNTGVVKMNLTKLKLIYTFEQMCKLFFDNVSNCVFLDQDFLNFYLEQNTIYKANGLIYNFQPYELLNSILFDQALTNAKILHFSWQRPWKNNCMFPIYYDLYLQYSFYQPLKDIVYKAQRGLL